MTEKITRLQEFSYVAHGASTDGYKYVVNAAGHQLIADFENLHDLFAQMKAAYEKRQDANKDFGSLLDSEVIAPDFYKDLDAVQFALNSVLGNSRGADIRAREKEFSERSFTLSERINSNNIACAEIALITKRFLEMNGYDVGFVSGCIAQEPSTELEHIFGANKYGHAFLLVASDSEKFIYIYDPTNPLSSEGLKIPCVTPLTPQSFKRVKNNAQKGNNTTFVSGKPVFSDRIKHYGFCDGPEINGQIGTVNLAEQSIPATTAGTAAPADP